MPAIVGGGFGDVEEVLCAGRALAKAGFRPAVYRQEGKPLPRGLDAAWAWPPHQRRAHLRPRARCALTVAPAWGITCAPERAEAFGRPGPWADETAEIERAYGPHRTVHVSLEEFARTLTPREETLERLREGGVRSRELPGRLARARRSGEVELYRRAYRRFRAFDRENVLHLYATFGYDRRFAREFPEAVQVGPLWPGLGPLPLRASRRGRDWVWYASPASAEAIAPAVVAGLRDHDRSPRLLVRTPRPWSAVRSSAGVAILTTPLSAAAWHRHFVGAGVRLVTGSRTLLEALEVGGPFLYFNGTIGRGAARHRHRPEKIAAFLRLARSAGWPPDLLRDLADFSRGRRVLEIVRRVAAGCGEWSRFPSGPRPTGFAPGYADAGALLVQLARSFEEGKRPASELVAAVREQSHP